MDYRTMLGRAFQSADGTPSPIDSFPMMYAYEEDLLSPFGPADFLHLMCRGQLEEQGDFSYSTLPFRGFLLMGIRKGSATLRQLRNFPVSAGSAVLVDCARPLSLVSRALPFEAEVFLMAGGPLDAYLPLIPSGGVLTFTPEDLPGIRQPLLSLREIPPAVSLEGLFSMNASLHALLTVLARSIYTRTLPSSDRLPYYLREMRVMTTYGCAGSFSLEACEARFHISRYRLCREYSAAFGVSPVKDLNNHRLEIARQQLLATDRRVQDIAASVGFDNPTHFINLFRRRYGMTPGRYRKGGAPEPSPEAP